MKEGDVGLDELLRMDAQSLAHEVNAIDMAALGRRVLASLGAGAGVDHGAPVPGRPARAAGRPGEEDSPEGITGVNDEIADTGNSPQLLEEGADELAQCMGSAQAGDPPSARRVAELLERADCEEDAARWWRLAAALGDPDAIDYVEGILGGDPSSSAGSQGQGQGQDGGVQSFSPEAAEGQKSSSGDQLTVIFNAPDPVNWSIVIGPTREGSPRT